MNNWTVLQRTSPRTLIFRMASTLGIVIVVCAALIFFAFGWGGGRRRRHSGADLDTVLQWVQGNVYWMIPLIVVAGVVFGMWSWLGFKFRLEDNALVTQDGLLLKTRKSARYHRIQNVKLNDSFPAKLFGLTAVELEVAGEDSEIEIEYLNRDDALALRDELQRRGQLVAGRPVR